MAEITPYQAPMYAERSTVKPRHELMMNVVFCECLTVDFYFPESSVSQLAMYLEYARGHWFYRPLRCTTMAGESRTPTSCSSVVFEVTVGRVALMRCILGMDNHPLTPTLRVTMFPAFIEAYGAGHVLYNFLNTALHAEFHKWHLHGHLRSLVMSYDVGFPLDGLVVWKDQLHKKDMATPHQYGNCRLIERQTEMLHAFGALTDHSPNTSVRWLVAPRTPMPLFDGARMLPNPMRNTLLVDKTVLLSFLHGQPYLAHTVATLEREPHLFPYIVRDAMSYHLRRRFVAELRAVALQNDFTTLDDVLWDKLWRDALLRVKCLSMFAA